MLAPRELSPDVLFETPPIVRVTLNALKRGERAVIECINGSNLLIRQRLLEMGLTRGTAIRVIRFAPMGDPIEIAVRGYRLSLRRAEAESIIIRRITL